MTLCTERIRTLDDIRAFLDGSEAADITPHDREAAYAFIERALVRFRYHLGLSRAGKGLVRAFWRMYHVFGDKRGRAKGPPPPRRAERGGSPSLGQAIRCLPR